MKKIKYIAALSACLLTSIKVLGTSEEALNVSHVFTNAVDSAVVAYTDPEKIFDDYRTSLIAYSNMWVQISDALYSLDAVPFELQHKKKHPDHVLDFSWISTQPLSPFLADPYHYFENLRHSLLKVLKHVTSQDWDQMFAVYQNIMPAVEMQLISLAERMEPAVTLYQKYSTEKIVENVTETDEFLKNIIESCKDLRENRFMVLRKVTPTLCWSSSLAKERLKTRLQDTALVKAMGKQTTENQTVTLPTPVVLPPEDFHLNLTAEEQTFLQNMNQLRASMNQTKASGWSAHETIMKYVPLLGTEVQTSYYENFENLFDLLKTKLESKQARIEMENIENVIAWLTDNAKDAPNLIAYMNGRTQGAHGKFMDTLRMLKNADQLLAPQQKENFQILRIVAADRLRDQYGHCETGARIRSFLTVQELLEFLK